MTKKRKPKRQAKAAAESAETERAAAAKIRAARDKRAQEQLKADKIVAVLANKSEKAFKSLAAKAQKELAAASTVEEVIAVAEEIQAAGGLGMEGQPQRKLERVMGI